MIFHFLPEITEKESVLKKFTEKKGNDKKDLDFSSGWNIFLSEASNAKSTSKYRLKDRQFYPKLLARLNFLKFKLCEELDNP